MKQPMLCSAKSLLLLMCLISYNTYAKDNNSPKTIPGSTLVDAEQLINIAGTMDKLVILDSRIQGDRQQGYIEHSLSLPDGNTDCNSLSRLVDSTQTPLLFYCNGPKCGRSAKAIKIAISCNYQNIYWFRGGFEEWKEKKYPYIK